MVSIITFITEQTIDGFRQWIASEERQSGTIEKYLRDVRELMAYLNGAEITKEGVSAWKEYLLAEKSLMPVTINSKIAAADTYCRFAGIDFRVKYLKVQKRLFNADKKNLGKDEYLRLIDTAKQAGKIRLALIMETIGATGIRVSELKYITVDAIRNGAARVHLKGKVRTILLPGKLCQKLLKYAKKNKIASGELFVTKSGHSISRKQVWSEMKAVCKQANVDSSKVFPHNLRHLFARVYYRATKDIAKLADMLGHSAIETTRIYLLTTETEHARQLNKLGLIL